MTFRERVIAMIIERLGEPERSSDPAGTLYRWRLKRTHSLDLHVIVDAPELHDQAHIILSDPCPEVGEVVRSIRIFNFEEVGEILDNIQAQWQKRGCWFHEHADARDK